MTYKVQVCYTNVKFLLQKQETGQKY